MIAILDNQDHLLCLLDDYTESNLHTFLQGTAAFFKCSVVQNSEYAQYFKVGNKVSFVWNDVSYHFDITLSTSNEQLITIQADSLTLELRNEDSSAYKANRAMTFKEYLDVFLFVGDNPIVLGINEVADKKLQLEWEGSEDSILARLFSLANKFSAEIEFETVLNKHWGLDKIKLNVYREHDDKHQGVGKRRTDILLEYGHNIETIEIEENINNLKTAIHATGKDGLTPASVLIDERDADGNQLYYSPIGDGSIRAVQARNQFMSKVNGEGYIAKNWTYDTDNPNVLAAQALAELKKLSKVEVTVKIKGYEYLGIGDTILAQDTGYNPVLNLEARISEQDIYFDNPENNTSTFTNVEILKSEVDESLLTRVRELIEENKVYDVQILTSNGYSFKNGFGETTLTARVMDGPKDVTNEFSLTWFKNSTEYAHTASINVQAGSIDELATYLIIAEKDGRERGRNELTVFNVKDGSPGKTPVVHLAWADSSDGSVGFTLELPTTKIPKYRGYYVDYSSVASTNPKLYKWERNPDDAAKVADEAKDKADNADTKADSAVSVAEDAKNTADEASKQTALVNELANTAKELADKANADAAEANRLVGLANTEIDRLNTDVSTAKSDLASAEAELNSKIETVKTTVTNDYAKKTELSDTKLTLSKTISDSVASVKQEMSETYAVKSDLTTLSGDYKSFKEDTAQKFSQQVSSIQTIQTDTTEAQKLANDAYSKAQSAVTSATNASSTANSALSKASDATSVANSASQNATNAVASANSAVSAANTAKSNADKAIADVAALTKTVSSQSTKIDQTSNRIEQVASEVTEVGSNLSNNYYQKTTVDSKLSTAVSGITAQYTQDITTRLGNYYDKSTIDSKLTIDGQGITTYVKNTQSKLDNLQVGGRNYLIGTNEEYKAFNLGQWSAIISSRKLSDLNLKVGDYITVSCDIKVPSNAIKGGRIRVQFYNSDADRPNHYGSICNIGEEKKLTRTVYIDSSLLQYKRVDLIIESTDTSITAVESGIQSKHEKLEIGNMATDWQPAPEDMATLTQYTQVKQLADQLSATVYDSASGLVTKTTQLANSYAIKQLNSSGDILTSLNLNANTSTAEINAKLIRLNGYTKMDDAFVNKLVANSIITNKIKSTEISGDIIKGGTIDGTIVKSTGANGTTQLMDGWFISTQNSSIGYYGAQSVNMTIFDTNGYAGSTKLTYSGFLNEMKNSDGVFAKRKITFHAEGFKIEPEDTNVGTNLNSGMHLVGKKAYLDFVANTIHRTDATPYHLRIIANEDGKSVVESKQGRLEIHTKNQEQLVVNSSYLPQTSMNIDAAVKQMTVAKPNESGTYLEIRNLAGKTWGITMWQSDQRLKDNITASTQDALSTINQLQVRQFDWKLDNVHEYFGLVAQEVEQVLPNAVFKVGDYYQIKDSGLIPVLIGAVQKLSNKVNLLENIIYNTKGGNLL
nr:MAG TPA: tail protein [Caudoviricetes sp.]